MFCFFFSFYNLRLAHYLLSSEGISASLSPSVFCLHVSTTIPFILFRGHQQPLQDQRDSLKTIVGRWS